jgi:hypothetical protein
VFLISFDCVKKEDPDQKFVSVHLMIDAASKSFTRGIERQKNR